METPINRGSTLGLHKKYFREKRLKILRKKAKNLLKIAAIYLGTVLGAGFASGQELVLFFVRFSCRGLLGCFLAGALFAFVGALILSKAHGLLEKTHRAYLKSIFGAPLASALAFVTEIFLCISFCIMLSGAGAFFAQSLSLPPYFGIFLTDAVCLLVFLYDLQGLSALNLILTPMMLLGTVFVSLYSMFSGVQTVWLPQIQPQGIFLPFALFYVGYNLLTATAVLVPASTLAEDKKTAAAGGFLGGLFLLLMAFLCCLALFFEEAVWQSPLPMLLLSKGAGRLCYICYCVVLYMAMLTTAVSAGYSVTQSLCGLGMKRSLSAATTCLAAVPLSFVEFSVLVENCYVFFGVLGMVLLFGILWDWYKTKK